MQRFSRCAILSVAFSALLALAFQGNASAQSIYGTGYGVGQTCSNSTYNGSFAPGGQVSCQITAPSQLTPGTSLLVTQSTPATSTPLQCSGTSGPGYTTQVTSNGYQGYPGSGGYTGYNGYPNLNTYSTSGGCVFGTSGFVPAGAPVGSVLVTLPNYAYNTGYNNGYNGYNNGYYNGLNGTLQLTVTVCTDPTCGGLLSSPYTSLTPPPPPSGLIAPPPPPPPPYTPYPYTPYSNGGYVTSGSCGNGFGSCGSYQGGNHGRHHHGDGDDGGDTDNDGN
jgi:hypothetical protein